MKFRIIIEQDEDGMFIAECPSLPGCISQGKTREDALENIKDAARGYLESLKKHNEARSKALKERCKAAGCL
jgi:predicted RNase H-like HicB family nuclease